MSALVILSVLFLFACASQPVVEKPPDMVWPLPPEKPRIRFVNIILGSADVNIKANKLKSILFGKEADTRFVKPFGVAVSDQTVYVTDVGAVLVFDLKNASFKIIGAGDLKMPIGIAATRERIYVGDAGRRTISVFDREWKRVLEFGRGEIGIPAGIAVDEQRKKVIVSDSKKNKVFIYGLDGRLLSQFGKRGVEPGEFNVPYGIAVDRQGRIYVVDSMNFRVEIFDENGKFLKSLGKVGTSAGMFARPKGVAVDSDGHIYVLDSAFGNFQIFDSEGGALLAVGNTGAGPAEFVLPSSICIDENDGIYVVDQINKRVQIFQYLKE